MKKILVIFCMAFLATFSAGNLFAQDVKLSIPLPLTGTNAKFGEIEKRSYEIAMEEINAKGGVKGRKIVLEFEDSQGKPEVSRSIAEKLIDVKKQPVIFGEYSSSCSKAVAAVAEERKTPYMVVTGATDDITQQNYKYVFRLNPTNAYYASGLMSFLKEVVKPTSIAVLYESSDFGTSGAEAYSALYIIKDVLTRAKSWTPDGIRVAMKATNTVTAFGPIKFEDKTGYTNQNFMDTLVLQVINGQFETIWPQKYATKKYVYPIPRWRDRK